MTSIVLMPFMSSHYRIFEPLTPIVILAIYGIQLRLTMIVILGFDDPEITSTILNGRSPSIVFGGLLALGIGFGALILGYHISLPRVQLGRFSVIRKQRWNEPALVASCCAIVAISAVGLLLLVRLTGGGLSSKRFLDLEGATRLLSPEYVSYRVAGLARVGALISVAYLAIGRQRAGGLMRAISWVSIALAVFVAFYINSRAGIVLLALDLFTIRYLLTKRLRVLQILLVGLGILLVTVVLLELRSETLTRDTLEGVEKTFVGRDSLGAVKTGHIIRTDGVAPLRGETLVGWTVAPVPDSMLPFRKPEWTGLGKYVYREAYDGTNELVGIPAGFVGELYLNLWWPGIPLGMLAFGVLLRALYRAFEPFLDRVNAAVIYTVIFTRFPIFVLGNDLGTGVIKTALDLVPVVIFLKLASRYEHRRRTSIPRTQTATGADVASQLSNA